MPIVTVLVALILAALALWAVAQLPLDATIVNIIRVVVIVALVIWVLEALGLLSGFMPLTHRR